MHEDPPSESIEGVYRTAEPIGHASDGSPCFILLRFYPEGLVLDAVLCKDVEADWPQISEWFNRENRDMPGIGSGWYTLRNKTIQFSMIVEDFDWHLFSNYERSGEYEPGHIRLSTVVHENQPSVSQDFIPLRAAENYK
jgi:hypothetical protein